MRRISLRKRLGLNLFARMYARRAEEHPLRTLFWECTLRCNLNCRHCGSDCKSEGATMAGAGEAVASEGVANVTQHPDMPVGDFLRVLDTIAPHVDPP